MTITEMLGQGGLLTLLGMCVVFSFIIILIICMTVLNAVVHAFKLDKTAEPTNNAAPAASAATASATAPAATEEADKTQEASEEAPAPEATAPVSVPATIMGTGGTYIPGTNGWS